jgi:ssRNA-specific RNase YbeY (16S rRNA maturation enzyme)
LDVPKNSSATGSCGNESQVINLTWSNSDNTTNELSIVFKKNSTDSRFMVGSINLTVTPSDEIFPSIKGKLKLSFTKL